MWIVGVLLSLATGSALTSLVGWKQRATPCAPPLWDIQRVAAAYTTIVGSLSGFTVASAVFLANLSVARTSQAFVDLVGLFLIAFLILMGAAVMLGTTPPTVEVSTGDEHLQIRHINYIISTVGFYLGTSISWLGLRPMLLALQLQYLADIFSWLLLLAILAGGVRLGASLYSLARVKGIACLSVPVVGLGVPAIYRLVFVNHFSSLWPSVNAGLMFAIITFGIGSTGFLFQSGLPALYGNSVLQRQAQRAGHRILLGYVQAVMMGIGFLWFSVVMS